MTPLNSTFAFFVNHLLAQEPWAKRKLQAHAGKIACIDLQAMVLRLKIAADGMLIEVDPQVAPDIEARNEAHNEAHNEVNNQANAEGSADVTIRLKLSDLPLIVQNRERAFSYVKVEGDADFANTISHLSQNLRWEAEEDLSKLFGDVAAVRLVSAANALVRSAQQAHQTIQENLAEYFLEENPMLVRPAAVQAFGAEVNKCRDDVERLIKRVEKLERSRQ